MSYNKLDEVLESLRVSPEPEPPVKNPFAGFGKKSASASQPEATPQAETPPPVSVSPVPVPVATATQPNQPAPAANPFAAAGGKVSDQDKKEKSNPETYLYDYVSNLELFMSKAGEPMATITHDDIIHNIHIGSQEFKDHLMHHAVIKFKSVLERRIINEAVYLAESLARFSNNKIELHNRMHFDGNKLTLDLTRSDGYYVVAGADGWALTKSVNYKFIRYPHSYPLPLPDLNGNVLELLPFLNIENELDKILVICWLIASFITTIPRAILCLNGSAGSAKTTQATMLKGLVDPSFEGGMYIRHKEDELALLLNQSAVPFFDNLSSLPKAIENLLCVASTGGGFGKKKLYSDNGVVRYSLKKPIIITGINVPYDAQDLLDRTISIELARISEEKRRYESEVMAAFEAAKPRILGGMLNVLCGAIRRLPSMKLTRLPRMADFALWIATIADEIGEENGFSAAKAQEAMKQAMDRGYGSSIAGDKFILALIDFLDALERTGLNNVSGTVAQCHEAFGQHALVLDRNADYIPSTPQLFSKILKKYVPVLEVNGWIVKFSDNRKNGRFLTFTKKTQGITHI